MSSSPGTTPCACPNCGYLLNLEASDCGSCGHAVAFDPVGQCFLHFDHDGGWLSAGGQSQPGPCANSRYGACNWIAAAAQDSALCLACRHNRLIPDLTVPGVLGRWRRIEEAKRRTIYALIRLGVPPLTIWDHPQGLQFDLLYDPAAELGNGPALLTGHQAGVVTINLIEADDVAREGLRLRLGEPYRTLVGHFRHELGHYYWHRLIEFSPDLSPFRSLFGDERTDYAAAVQRHYSSQPPVGWDNMYVSRYASMHPWEDFAETFAHYLHIVDTLATIGSFGTTIECQRASQVSGRLGIDFDAFTADTATIISHWIPLAFALNAINRSMGRPDLYPFKITPQIVLKLDFVNRLMAFAAGRWTAGEQEAAGLRAMVATLGHGFDLTETA